MDCYKVLEKAFVATFMDELLPGIFHNFANPLNGIMGRAKLMQRRLNGFVRTIETRYPAIAKELSAEYGKLLSDIDSVNNESERFFNMFVVSTGKFYAIGAGAPEKLNLSRILETELAFSDFYLDFKHHVKKEVSFDPDLPELKGITSHVSMAFWLILREGMKQVRAGSQEIIRIATGYDKERVFVRLACPDDGSLANALAGSQEGKGGEKTPLACAVELLQCAFPGTEAAYDRESQQIVIGIPYHIKSGKGAGK